jgi:hypothetical protein
MVHKYGVFPQIQATVIAYVQGERTFYDAQFVCRKRSVYAQLLIGAERHAREGGISLGPKKVAKLLRLLCWMCDTANELGKHRSPPHAAEAA